MRSTITISYCPKCHWLLRAAYMAQEFLTTFENELDSVSLQPSDTNGEFQVLVNASRIFDRKQFGGFPEIKELKQMVRDVVAPMPLTCNPEEPREHSGPSMMMPVVPSGISSLA